MKKLAMTVVVLACAASVVSAQVYSENIVGYTKVQAVGGQLSLVALNFETGGALVSDLCGPLPALSAVYLWDKTNQQYIPVTKNTRGAWVGDTAVNLGDAFWIAPSGTGTNELIFSGEVLTDDAMIDIPVGLTATGYFYPVEMDFRTTQMASDLAALSAVYLWDDAAQGYIPWTKNTRGAWVGSGNANLDPKGGFWIDNAGEATQVTEPVPFTP